MFLTNQQAKELVQEYGYPLYIYDESTLRKRSKEIKGLLSGFRHSSYYSAKANSNPELLKIIRMEGLQVDAMSPGELYLEKMAGYTNEEIFYVCNNISRAEMEQIIKEDILMSVDSISQLELYGMINPGGRIAIRINPELGAGHHEKVVTGGKKTKFGIQIELIPEVKKLLDRYQLRLVGINQHIGSLFMEEEQYVTGASGLLDIALAYFPGLEFIDFGGGFGVPYREGERRLNLAALDQKLSTVLGIFMIQYDNPEVMFRSEPGRYIVAESGVLLSKVNAVKDNHGTVYIGTDIGQNILARPSLYDAYHEIQVIKAGQETETRGLYTIVGNICESGDVLAKKRILPHIEEGDLIAVKTVGAYGYSMASNYTCRMRPAEVLIEADGNSRLIRRRDRPEDLSLNLIQA